MAGRKQFDVDVAVDQAMAVFWQRGYTDASLEVLAAATGLGRGSFYGAFVSKDALFRRCLERYGATYGARYERALAAHPDDPTRAVAAFFEVVLERIGDPTVPDGCLIAQSVAQSAVLDPASRTQAQSLLARQRERIRAALVPVTLPPAKIDELALFVVGVNQSLAVLSRAGVPSAELRSVVGIACSVVANAGHATPLTDRHRQAT